MTNYRCYMYPGALGEWIAAESPAHAAQEYHYRIASKHDPHVLTGDDGTLTIYGVVLVDGEGEWTCRTYHRPLRRKGGVKGPAKPRKNLDDIEKAMGLVYGSLAGPWDLEEQNWQ